MNRRNFLKTLGFAAPVAVLFGKIPRLLWAGKMEHSGRAFWQDGKFLQDSVDVAGYDKGMIRARIDGAWREFALRKCSPEFVEWNLAQRRAFIDNIKAGTMPGFGGPHSGAVATYGMGRYDSGFTLNNAIKGVGLAPADDNLDRSIERLRATFDRPMPEKMGILREMYETADGFDWRKQTSLELYSTPDFETHTFLNVMHNPAATLVFLDVPSFEIRTICRIVHPDDASALEPERKLVEFVNLAHEYMHGKFPRKFPLLLFYVVEEFDNTPGSKMGVRVGK